MFTGIIREIGTIVRKEEKRGVVELAIEAPKTASGAVPMESIAVNGVCLTAIDLTDERFSVEVIPETIRLTGLSRLKAGSRVNVEPSLLLTDRLNGHLVFGHVDGIGRVARRAPHKGQLVLDIAFESRLRPWLVPKGPIALDGVSLTLGDKIGVARFSVYLIPETLRRTTLGDLKPADPINLELDYFAKLARQWAKK